MKKLASLLFFIFISIFSFSEEKEKLVIGVIYDGITEENKIIQNLISQEVTGLLGSKYEVIFPENKQLIDSFNRIDISNKMDQLLADDEVDIVIAGGVLSSYLSLKKNNISKPLFAPFIINNAGVSVNEKKNSNKRNLNFISTDLNIKSEIENFRKINNFNKLTILIGEEIENIIPEVEDFFENYVKVNKIDLEYEFISVNKTNIDEVIKKLENAEAISIAPMKSLDVSEILKILNYANKNKIPTFSALGAGTLDLGILAGHSYEKEVKKRIRAMAVNMTLFLDGEKVEELPVFVEAAKSELIINMEVIEKTGIWPSWEVIAQSKLINFESEKNSPMAVSLKEVLEIAVENNPMINSLKEEVEKTDLQINKAKSNYKPDITANATFATIDKDRAESILSPAEKTLEAGVTLTQVIFSEDANMNVDIKKKQKKIKEEELRQAELDLILETSEAYFMVLKAEAYARIQKTSLELTKNNLEIAKGRKAAGISGSADIYRLESELANSVTGLISAMLNINIAKTNLKRIMNNDLIDNLEIKNIDLNDENLMTSDKDLMKYISNQNKVESLVKYMTEKALIFSPEIKSLENGVEIYERMVKNSSNKRYMPTVALQAKYTVRNIVAEGEGSETPDFSSIGSISDVNTKIALGDILNSFGSADENDWSVGVGFSLPLYSGGEIKIDKEIAEQEVKTLEYKKEALKKGIEQKVITYTLQIVAEYSKINNAEISSNSASKALELVKDAYSRGVASISDLLSAQTALISATQYKTTVTYDLMAAIMRAERAVGNYYIFRSPEDRIKVGEEIKALDNTF